MNKEIKQKAKLWVRCNIKEATREKFEKITGISFSDFKDKYKLEVNRAWQSYLDEKKSNPNRH